MNRRNTDGSAGRDRLSRRKLLSLGVGSAGVALGVGGLTGTTAAWRRFDADFVGCEAVRLVIHPQDLRYDPPAVAHVVVATDGDLACRTVECTPEAATRMPDCYGDSPVVPYEAASDETVLGVIEYNYRADRFSEPVCLLANDNPCAGDASRPALHEADCVRAGVEGYWEGELRECWFDPLDRPEECPDGPGESEDGGVDTGTPRQRLAPPAPTPGAGFGTSIARAADGDVLLIGAPGASPDGTTTGAVYVYRQGEDGWHHSGTIAPEGAGEGADVGQAVAANATGDLALVGAPGKEISATVSGAAYHVAFDGSTWTTRNRLTAAAWLTDDRFSVHLFGDDVALASDGQTAVVGAPYATLVGIHTGLALAFERDDDGWTDGQELVRPDPGDSQQFGRAVDVAADGERAIAGAPVPFPGTVNPAGYVGVYPRADDWAPGSFLQYDEGKPGALLGTDACCNDACDLVLAGDPRNNEGSVPRRPGRVHAFARDGDTWVRHGMFEASDAQAGDGFGTAVAVDAVGRRALVGAPGTLSSLAGFEPAVYALERQSSGWQELRRVDASETGASGSFGSTVALDAAGQSAYVGAPEATVDGVDAGAAFVYELVDP